jgi:hypothetical protein
MSLFANRSMDQKKKLNELIEAINEKDELLDSQEDFLIKENKKFVKLKIAYAQEVEKCENLTKELSICHDSISSLRNENASLVSKVKESTVEHVSICTRCRDVNVEAMDDHLAMIKQQNNHIAKLTAKIAEHELENENFKFARSMLYNGRRPALRMALVSNRGAMSCLMPLKDCLILLRARLPWFRIVKVIFYILLTILSTKLGEFMLGNLIIFLIMHLCINMRLLALGIPLMLKCLKRKLSLHQMIITFHLRLLMLHMF